MNQLNKALIGTISLLFIIFIASLYFKGSSYSAAVSEDKHRVKHQSEEFHKVDHSSSKTLRKEVEKPKGQAVVPPQPAIKSSASCSKPIPATHGKIAYLTFDDGPTKYTTSIINILEQNQAKGTFFLVGNLIQYHEESVRALMDSCETIGLHTMTHNQKFIYNPTSPTYVQENITERSLLLSDFHYDANLARAPYGSTYLTETMIDGLYKNHFKLWDWTIDSEDWHYKPHESHKIVENISKQLKRDTEVILMHERAGTVKALPEVIKLLKSRGYTTFLPYDVNHHFVENFRNDVRF